MMRARQPKSGNHWLISFSVLLIIATANTTLFAQDDSSGEVVWTVEFSQNFAEAGIADFLLGPAVDESRQVQSGVLDVEFEPDTDGNTAVLSGDWYDLRIWWFSIWIGIAEDEASQLFAIGGQCHDGLYGKAFVYGELPLTPGRYRIIGRVSDEPTIEEPAAEEPAAEEPDTEDPGDEEPAAEEPAAEEPADS